MPELPEVETVVRDLRAAGLEGRTIRRALLHWPGMIDGGDAARFCRLVRGRRIRAIARRGKFIRFELSGGWTLLAHLRMTGQFELLPSREPRAPHERAALVLDDGRELRFRDTRKFGRWQLVRDAGARLARLGPEPLAPDFSAGRLQAALRGRRGRLKPLLLNQAIVAGLGNIYADESLWVARLHPARSAGNLSAAELRRLHAAMRTVLRRAVAARGTSLGDGQTNFRGLGERRGGYQRLLRVYGRTGEPCRRCGTAVQRIVLAQRGTHFCPRCQILGRRAGCGRTVR